jgi:hypothetical protein
MTSEELRALDAEIHRKVFGKEPRRDALAYHGNGPAQPEYSKNIAAAWLVHAAMCDRPFSVRRRYLQELQDIASERVNKTRREALAVYTPAVVAWPDVLVVLRDQMSEAICLAARKAVAPQPAEDASRAR